jgi:hypothetical protein
MWRRARRSEAVRLDPYRRSALLSCPLADFEPLPRVAIGIDRRAAVLIGEQVDQSANVVVVERVGEGQGELDGRQIVFGLN